MKKYAVLFYLAVVCLSCAAGFAQSRRVPPTSESGKINKRDQQPTPTPTPVVEESEPVIEDTDPINIDTELVTVPVKVLDRGNRFVSGLKKEDFQILEDNAPQEIAYFSNEEQPFTVALVLDMSYSTTFKIAEIQSAALAFIGQLRENDKVMVVSFDETVHLLCNPTTDRKQIYAAIKSTKIESGTSLYDAVDLVINEGFRKISGRKAIVLFTDGVDTTSSRAFASNNIGDALESDALIYPVQYHTFKDVQAMKNKPVIITPPTSTSNPFPTIRNTGTPGSQGTTAEDYRKAQVYLNDLATRTGGRIYKADSTANLADAYSRIAAELREYYSLGYYPKTESNEGKRLKIKVSVNRQDTTVRARDSYVVRKKVKK
jgi:Ca-activated chloride channel homolog